MELLNNYDMYILNENNMVNYLKYKITKYTEVNTENINPVNKKIKNVKINNLFIPKEQDSLFWCYYIIKNGDISYEMLNNKNILLVKQMKIDLIKIIRNNKELIKLNKFDTLSKLEYNLVNDNNINLKTLLNLFLIDNINLIFVSRKTYYELMTNDNNIIYIIREILTDSKYENSSKKYGFELGNDESIDEIRKTLYKIDKIDKPINALSSYKLNELQEIASKLAIEINNKETGKNKTKPELYESIIQYF